MPRYTTLNPYVEAIRRKKKRAYIARFIGSGAYEEEEEAWSPSALFASSEIGVWYDPSDLTTMWTDDGTTNAGVGDLVYRIDDKSGNGFHAKQTTEASRPVLRESGGLYYLEFDGTDDFLVTSAIDFSATDKMTVFAGVNRILNTPGRKMVVGGIGDPNSVNGSFGFSIPIDTSDLGLQLRGTQLSGNIFALVPALNVLSGQYDLAGGSYAANTRLRANAVALTGSGSGNPTSGGGVFGNGIISVGRIPASTGYFGGNLYSIIVRGALSDATEIDNAEAYVNGKTGAY